MGSKTQRKKRYQRRRAHAVLTHGRPGLVAAVEDIVGKPLYPYQKAMVEALATPPKRAQCPECGTSQKVRADGTMGKHTCGPEGRTCEGTGKRYDEHV